MFIIEFTAQKFSRSANEQPAKPFPKKNLINSRKLVRVCNVPAVQSQQVLYTCESGRGNMQGVRSSFLWHCVGLEQQFSKSFRFRSQFNKWTLFKQGQPVCCSVRVTGRCFPKR
ncbi:MAG: hypothetical protein ACK48Y_05875, partial [Planctomyces sp.]